MSRSTPTTIYFALGSGLCAAASSLFGKLSGLQESSTVVAFVLKVTFLLLMVVFNIGVWSCFVKALQQSTSSLPVTVSSSAVNYILSALLGIFIFGESTSVLWWIGAALVLIGLMLICQPHREHKD